jgi:hemerythrin-like domain-containing protein
VSYEYERTDRQAILVNSDLFFENDPSRHLSPRQLRIFAYIEENSDRSWKKLVNRKSATHAHEDIIQKWAMVTERIEKRSRGKVKIH